MSRKNTAHRRKHLPVTPKKKEPSFRNTGNCFLPLFFRNTKKKHLTFPTTRMLFPAMAKHKTAIPLICCPIFSHNWHRSHKKRSIASGTDAMPLLVSYFLDFLEKERLIPLVVQILVVHDLLRASDKKHAIGHECMGR